MLRGGVQTWAQGPAPAMAVWWPRAHRRPVRDVGVMPAARPPPGVMGVAVPSARPGTVKTGADSVFTLIAAQMACVFA